MFLSKTIWFVIFFLVCTPNNALAYLDPGAGSFVLQILLASFFGALFFLKSFIQRIKDFFVKLISKAK